MEHHFEQFSRVVNVRNLHNIIGCPLISVKPRKVCSAEEKEAATSSMLERVMACLLPSPKGEEREFSWSKILKIYPKYSTYLFRPNHYLPIE